MKLRALLATLCLPFLALTVGGCPAPSPTVTSPPPNQSSAKSPTIPGAKRPTISNQSLANRVERKERISTPPLTASTEQNSALLLGNPSQAGEDADNHLVRRPQFDLSYNQKNGGPNWVAWHLGADDLGTRRRGNDFRPDPLLLASAQIRPTDYRGSGYDRGHQCPSGDRTDSRENNSATFVMSNMLPQAPALNQQVWAKLENYARAQVRAGNELYICAGGLGSQSRIAGGKVNVPQACWKILVVLPQGESDLSRMTAQTRVIAVLMPNQDTPEVGGARWAQYITSVDDLEQKTGYDFLSALPDSIEAALESKKDSGRGSRDSETSFDRRPSRVPSTRVERGNGDGGRIGSSLPETSDLPSSTGSGVEQSSPTQSAQLQAPAEGQSQVWVNTRSGVYHFPGARWYGNTKEGAYMSESQAQAQGYRAAENGQ